MSPTSLRDTFLAQVVDLLRETFEGGLPGQGTQYLDHSSGIRSTLRSLTAEQASRRFEGHPSIAAHVRHMNFHLRVTSEWILGDHSRRDWAQSFEPQSVSAEEWPKLLQELEASRQELVRAFEYLSLLNLGPHARSFNHVQIARQLGEEVTPDRAALPEQVVPATPLGGPERRHAVEELAMLYEKARYAPPEDPLPDAALALARHDLCLLAGVTAA